MRAVYNLREESGASRALALQAGLNYHHLPVEDWNVPTLAQVLEFLEMLKLPDFSPGLVHCWGGVGRTGIFVSCYRASLGLDMEAAIERSDLETPHLMMNGPQRNWLRQHAGHFQISSSSTGQ
ncbi:MAG: protein-tyrosine phosphatase family protein [Vulcanimicrobiota bacterium]